ncbi:hypothetical protein AUJ66_06695 [Candidatus Desantisbacteria bacterium CG1_02_38_46]|uniref:FAD dependent oxidoreductase domain-containing protein n=3 Tax=unclassified Candidatus Desantisiibacteriota TaxID=3106372 RepID=A0A2H9PBS5_9BACT|nr:MAG: hypothetical protein AUJ66_06695 [Candidatus Desantisbacteria bacterium CG1_02_38_46]PIU50728.1 MAG: hypothetical protein COS91_08215 [Candidatus Desantisbacteria bacterium CG07_land_8_20_14_0_80_39_15]PIZ16424.1 MAG: hypothetical protein COY51_02845 [Candidatus Desantisbacteria bacterium CG_4_10_14_0_8_um_filter_39_17]
MNFPKSTDVIIIGGGLVGCSVGYQLAKRGRDVIILEMRNLASGASGRNGGMVTQLDGRDKNKEAILNRLNYTRENNKMLAGLAEELSYDFEYNRCGGIDIACSEEEWEYFKKLVPFQKEVGDEEVILVDKQQLKDLCSLLSDIVWGARYRPTDGTLNPFKLNIGFALAAKKYKAKVFTETKIEKIVIKHGTAIGVETNNGYIQANLIINAANAWAPLLIPEIDILPLRQVAVVTERIPELPVYSFEAIIDRQVIFGSTQQKSGNLLVGGLGTQARKREDHYKEDLSPYEIEGSTAIFNILFKGLGDVNIIRSWAGTMAFTADGLPCIGPIPQIQGLYIVAGFSNGMAFAPIIGKLVAEDLTQGKPSITLKPFNPERFYNKKISWPDSYNYTVLAEFLERK